MLLFILAVAAIASYAQKKELIEDKNLIIERAKAELGLAMSPPEGAIYLWTLKNPIQGSYTYDISIREKGEVMSVFAVGNENGTIKAQNNLKDLILTLRLNFNMPKGKSYKFQHTFVFE